MRVKIKPLREADLLKLEKTLREIDRLEVEAMLGPDIRNALFICAQTSFRAKAAYANGKLVAAWGIGSRTPLSREGCPWLLATTEMDKPEVRKAFLQRSREEFEALTEGYHYCWNYVHAANRTAIKWLKWLGFTFTGDEATVAGEPFLYFKKEAI
jgi:hypothetical protein